MIKDFDVATVDDLGIVAIVAQKFDKQWWVSVNQMGTIKAATAGTLLDAIKEALSGEIVQ